MQDEQAQNQTAAAIAAQEVAAVRAAQGDFVKRIVEKVKGSENILVALSKTPSVDELAAAIGLTLFLDGMQRHVTAIYSGKVPKSLEFLQPETVFEKNTASLQDFIIALNKDKADHLRYKLEGDLVRIYITPYKTMITENDLTFERGDYNVDFIIAINVKSVTDLDDALADYGKILHDASTVNITVRDPGRFGEIEWSNQAASSVCEMMTELVFAIQGNDTTLDNDVATALLAGIVAATDRFSNSRTNSETLGLASKLMALGADQQLITANVLNNNADMTPDAEKPQAPVVDPVNEARLKAQAEAKSAIEQGMPSDAKVEKMTVTTNPAAEAAQRVVLQNNGPAPADVNIPSDTPAEAMADGEAPAMDANGVPINDQAARKIAAEMPLNTASAVVMPTMANGAANNTADNSRATGAVSVASIPSLPPVQEMANIVPERQMAAGAPAQPAKPIQGVTLTPPVAKEEEKKDYGAMMDAALAEPLPPAPAGVKPTVAAPVTPPVGKVASAPVNATVGVANADARPAVNMVGANVPVDNSVMRLPGVPVASVASTASAVSAASAAQAVPVPRPVAAPSASTPARPANGPVLPPPPAPDVVNGVMPPILPPVQ